MCVCVCEVGGLFSGALLPQGVFHSRMTHGGAKIDVRKDLIIGLCMDGLLVPARYAFVTADSSRCSLANGAPVMTKKYVREKKEKGGIRNAKGIILHDPNITHQPTNTHWENKVHIPISSLPPPSPTSPSSTILPNPRTRRITILPHPRPHRLTDPDPQPRHRAHDQHRQRRLHHQLAPLAHLPPPPARLLGLALAEEGLLVLVVVAQARAGEGDRGGGGWGEGGGGFVGDGVGGDVDSLFKVFFAVFRRRGLLVGGGGGVGVGLGTGVGV